MKTIFILILFTISFGKLYSQTERYIYETQVNPDTINLVSMIHERTFLDIKKGHSTFISENKFLKDSLISVFRNEQESLSEDDKKRKKEKLNFPKLADGKSLQPSFFNFFIEKNIDKKEVWLVENVGQKQIYYLEDRKINWEISKDVQDINGYKAQKATTKFGGRIWTAWFAPDIKISNGPYKFYGLPGLILKLEDETGDYRFTFLKKINVPDSSTEIILPNAKKSTREDFIGDKAAIELEFAQKNRNKSSVNSGFASSGRRGGMKGGGMRGGGMNGGERNGGGMNNNRLDDDGQMGAPKESNGNFEGFNGQRNGFGNESQTGNTTNNFRNISDGNPIELK